MANIIFLMWDSSHTLGSLNLALHLKKKGHRVIYADKPGEIKDDLKNMGFEIVEFFKLSNHQNIVPKSFRLAFLKKFFSKLEQIKNHQKKILNSS